MESLLAVQIRTLAVLYVGTFMFGASICSAAADAQGAKGTNLANEAMADLLP
jgi:hypothetical protein